MTRFEAHWFVAIQTTEFRAIGSGPVAGRAPLVKACLWATLALGFLAGCESGNDSAKKVEEVTDAESRIVREATKGPVSMRVEVSPKQPKLSDSIKLSMKITSEPNVDIVPPPFGEAVGRFVILDYRERKPQTAEGKIVRVFDYVLEPPFAGKHLIHSLEATFTDRRTGSEQKDQAVKIDTAPIEIEISSEFGNETPDLAKLASMDQPMALPAKGLSTSTWGIVGFLVLVLAGVLAGLALRKKKVVVAEGPRLSPEEIAYSELNGLRESRWVEEGRFVDFYVELTGIVRRYIERTTGIHAPEQTTEEFLRAMRGDQRFDSPKAKQLEAFLAASDMVKYAALKPDTKDIEDAFAKAADFVSGQKGSGILSKEQAAVAVA